ncbi:glycosyl transferase [Microbacterium barkeri]|uniref:Glycosyl transferase n=1 Tax=Microbacterium barkeri TaxID=33917 RepID=A0A9W6H2C6_9MICO|nr:glycosyltransferase [Microbacterium barkeri]MDI6942724.1 glycosyltransferase [Microbacterium barkeri]MDR6875116.1 UDP-N-acetylglucosamine transferase subunit ALG13 [Microbacterium barkeri]GLJ60724.1 glycosyl transferase [Microbacterium barkeri]
MSDVTRVHATARPHFRDTFGHAPKVLWIASSGGHVAQAHRIERLLGVNQDSLWVTFDVPQTRSLLAGRRHVYVDYVAPRDRRRALAAALEIDKIRRAEKFDHVISTGAAIAFFSLPLARLRGARVTYIESLARSTGPSLTGRMMQRVPGIQLRTQYPSWAGGKWEYSGTILDSFRAEPNERKSSGGRKVFVTLGTIRPYRFDRAVDAVLSLLRPEDDVVWQLGETRRDDLPGHVATEMPGDEMKRRMREADVIVTHSGVGSILAALELGKAPVLAVRSEVHDEHVDDHQRFIADVMEQRGLAVRLDLESPSVGAFERAMNTRIGSGDVTG